MAAIEDDKFVSLLLAYQCDLRAFILSLVPHEVDADDLLQEVNHALLRKKDSYDVNHDFRRWAFGFAALEVRSFRSRASKSRLWFNDETLETLAGDWVQGSSLLDDCRDYLAKCLQNLGDRERRIIDARYGKQSSFKQIAEESGKPLGTVYSIYKRAIRSLRICIERSRPSTGPSLGK